MNIKKFLKKRERGQGLVEYALILVLVAIVVLAVLLILGPQVGSVFSNVVANFERIGVGGGGGISFTVSPNGPNYKVSVTVSQSMTVSVSATNGSVSPGSKPCEPDVGCIFLLNPSGGSGTVTVSGGGTTVTQNWP